MFVVRLLTLTEWNKLVPRRIPHSLDHPWVLNTCGDDLFVDHFVSSFIERRLRLSQCIGCIAGNCQSTAPKQYLSKERSEFGQR